jgi:hypothetical protein
MRPKFLAAHLTPGLRACISCSQGASLERTGMNITSRYSDIPEVAVDESKIPIEVRPLLPLAKEWSISDDAELAAYIAAASEAKRRQFFDAFRPHFTALAKWHKESSHLVPQPDELVIFDIAANAAAAVGASLRPGP